MFINYAHRGASQYAPENTMASFYLGYEMKANGIETDVRSTSDGRLVLFHDDSLMRIANIDLSIEECTYKELLEMDFGSFKSPHYRNERVVLLEDFLKYFSGKDLILAIEIKGDGIEADTMRYINKYNQMGNIEVTSFSIEHLKNIRSIDKNTKLGYLTENIENDTLDMLDQYSIGQVCPRVSNINRELVSSAQERGFCVRGWGVENTTSMRFALQAGVNGMTVNFPDKLVGALKYTY